MQSPKCETHHKEACVLPGLQTSSRTGYSQPPFLWPVPQEMLHCSHGHPAVISPEAGDMIPV